MAIHIRSIIAILFMVVSFSCIAPTEENSDPVTTEANRIETLTDDGVWCWFSDPRAIYHQGQKEQIYFGTITSGGDVVIGAKDLASGMVSSFILHDSLEVDDHNVPAILILPNGHLLAFYNEHNGDVFMRRSSRPEDISAWEPERVICQSTETYRYTYTNPVQLSGENGRIYLIGRKVGPTRSFEHWWQYIKYSDDEGQNWSEEVILLDNEGRKNPPYLKVATDHQSRIDFLFTDGHPKIGPDVSVFHMYYQDGGFFQTDGAPIARWAEAPIAIRAVNKVYDAVPSQVRGWIWDIVLKDGRPHVTYARFPSEADHIYHYAYWADGDWQDQKVVNSGSWMVNLRQGDQVREAHYSGGVVMNPNRPDHLFLSRDVAGKFEIEHWEALTEGLWTNADVTENSEVNNVRPYVVYQAPPDTVYLLWMKGIYRHYTEYDMGIQLMELH
ncbi:BNR-4 repeat-containing protein [Flavilitoribacter nigricans]|uniref:Exo-alpha-sialidase n=1 Tax=Flavilitoribacter nigricans (strain ATCC 23147 / DSM 23189 / NBRC 102662 / NCIMB 1420 / SS-2) TaxID=1122177 RepID=A0A2D0NE47_FLAN2|nr:BNR-4 repeat-containing protein [Flavilitoribacter nigricans]PHN06772.1 hypothetical protein CRP01_10805 [Flavilitoribacter nigricans DSM 23189 = NBRC 102662]